MCALRHPCRDGSEPWRVSAGRVCPHDAADVAGAVEHVIIIVRPLAARVGLVGLFKHEHGVVEVRYFLHGQAARKASTAKALKSSFSLAGRSSMYFTTTRIICVLVTPGGAQISIRALKIP